VTTTLLASFPSPPQGVWHLGPIPLRAYALFILVGVIAALFIGNKRWSERGGEPGVIFDIALWAIIFGLIGGRLYHVLTDWSTYFGPGGAGLVAAFKIQEGGLGIWGAVALGGVGAWIGCRRKGIPLPAFGDAVAPGIVLAQAIGRIGNYFNQELYGRATSLPWGLEIFERRDAHGALDSLNGVSTGQLIEVVHPTFLYELLWNLLVFALLIWVDRRYRIGHGRLFALYVAAYCFGRFWIELMRSDMATHIAGIRINSFVSVFVFIGAVVYIMVAPKGREDPSELRGNAAFGEKAALDAGDAPTEQLEKELVAVAATTGVVAAAKVAGEKEDEDAQEEKFGSGNAEEPEVEAVAEGEQLVEDVTDAPAEDIAEAEAFAEAGEEADAAEDAEVTEAIGGVGAVEGDEVVEAQEAAPEVHGAAVEDADEAAEVADEVAAEAPDDSAEPLSEGADAESVEPEVAEDQPEDAVDAFGEPEAEAVGGVGAVEGDEVVEAQEAAPEVHGAAPEDAEEAAEVADEVADEAPDDSAEPLSEGADAESVEPEVAVDQPEDAEEAAEVADEVSDEASDEPESGSSESEDAGDQSEQPAEEAIDESADSDSETGAVGGVGAVEGDEVVEAQEAAPEVHEAADEAAEGADAAAGRTRRRFGFRRRRNT
jgi:phosphatidylglycerol---prolipoprotein diacylglyceryl transferase